MAGNFRSALVVLLGLVGVMLGLAGALFADVIPPDLAPGSQYELLFVTADTRDALSNNIADYNTFVTNEAKLSPTLPTGVTWKAVASTVTTAANVNAPNSPGMPVYNTQGQRLTNAGLYWTPSLLALPDYDQYGNNLGQNSVAWTGSISDGSPYEIAAIGSSLGVELGFPSLSNRWLMATVASGQNQFSLYALSSPITVLVPEPSNLVLMGAAAVSLLACGWRRRQRRATWD